MSQENISEQTELRIELVAAKPHGSQFRSEQAIRLLLEVGINKEAIASLLEISEFNIQHVRYLAGPVIVHKSAWAETLPSWLPKACLLERLDLIFEERKTGKVGDLATQAEVLACIYPASLDAPLDRDWTDVYLWVGNEVMQRHKRLKEQNLWELIGQDRPPKFSGIKSNYDQLARDIRRKVVEEGKKRGWGQREKAPPARSPNPQTTQDVKREPSVVQISLF